MNDLAFHRALVLDHETQVIQRPKDIQITDNIKFGTNFRSNIIPPPRESISNNCLNPNRRP